MTTDQYKRKHVYTIMLTHDYKCEQSCTRRHLYEIESNKKHVHTSWLS